MKKIYLLLFGLIFISIPLYSQNKTDSTSVESKTFVEPKIIPDEDLIVAERPGFTNPPAMVPKKHLQIEAGFSFESDKDKTTQIKYNTFLYPTTFFRYGVTNNLELRLEVDLAGYSVNLPNTTGQQSTTQSGLNPVTIGAKFHICDEKKARPEAAFVFGLTLPYIGRDDFQPLYPAPSLAFYFQNTLNSKWTIGYNIGAQWNGNDANPTSLVTFSPSYNFTNRFSGFAEIYAYFQKSNVPDFRCDAGLAYIPIPNLQIDFSGGPGIAGPINNYFIAAGISIRLPK